MQESWLDFPGGFILIKGELTELGWKFFNLMHHNQQVFIPYYAKILKQTKTTTTKKQCIIPSAQAQETEVGSDSDGPQIWQQGTRREGSPCSWDDITCGQ